MQKARVTTRSERKSPLYRVQTVTEHAPEVPEPSKHPERSTQRSWKPFHLPF